MRMKTVIELSGMQLGRGVGLLTRGHLQAHHIYCKLGLWLVYSRMDRIYVAYIFEVYDLAQSLGKRRADCPVDFLILRLEACFELFG